MWAVGTGLPAECACRRPPPCHASAGVLYHQILTATPLEPPHRAAPFRRFTPGDVSLVTVKGAGHMVPQSKPAEALELVTRFLANDL